MIDYAEVIEDLTARQERLRTIIELMREMMERPDAEDRLVSAKRPQKGRKATLSDNAPDGPKTTSEEANPLPSLSMRDAIRRAVAEAPRTATEVADRVVSLLPAANRNSISTQICQLISEGKFRKDDQLKVHPVANGRIPSEERV